MKRSNPIMLLIVRLVVWPFASFFLFQFCESLLPVEELGGVVIILCLILNFPPVDTAFSDVVVANDEHQTSKQHDSCMQRHEGRMFPQWCQRHSLHRFVVLKTASVSFQIGMVACRKELWQEHVFFKLVSQCFYLFDCCICDWNNCNIFWSYKIFLISKQLFFIVKSIIIYVVLFRLESRGIYFISLQPLAAALGNAMCVGPNPRGGATEGGERESIRLIFRQIRGIRLVAGGRGPSHLVFVQR